MKEDNTGHKNYVKRRPLNVNSSHRFGIKYT